MGVVFAGLYIATFLPRQSDVPAILSGVLGGAVVFFILKEVDERRKRRMRQGAVPPVRRKHRRD
jgi:mannitol-specific phosphotransferase system IIBC component